MSTPRTRRYPGLHYFTAEQKDLFFGREAEKRDLIALVLTEKIVALFSKSGYGKSSLLRAGLAPELPTGWLPVIVQFGAYQAGQSPTPLARTLAQLDAALPDDAPEMDFLETVCPEDSLWKRFKKKQNGEKRTFLLIFDQFEEFQTYPAEQCEAFKKQLAELLFTRIPQMVRDRADPEASGSDTQQDLLARPNEVKALFAIREDRLGVLDGLADKLPAILHKRYHLQGLDDAQATAAITLPAALPQGERFESPAFRYAPAAVEAIKKGLKKDERDPHIESFLLQICCEAIEQKVVGFQGLGGEIVVTEADLPVFKDLFEQYYRGKITALPDEARRNAARRMIEDQLVKTDPASGIAYRINADGRALCALPGVDENLLKQLTDFFLLRSEPNTTGGFSYEVSHDRLVEGILVMKREFEEKETDLQLMPEDALLRLIQSDKIVTLYSKSGFRKSTLLRLGLVPLLPENWCPIFIKFGLYWGENTASLVHSIIAAVQNNFQTETTEMEFIDRLDIQESLWKYFKKRQTTEHRTFLLIFDQFEEFLTYPLEQQEEFKRQLSELLYTLIPQKIIGQKNNLTDIQQNLLARPIDVKAIFAIREDRLARFIEALSDKIPSVFYKHYYLRGLNDLQAAKAIENAGWHGEGFHIPGYDFIYSPAAIQTIINGLIDPHENTIDPFLLNIYLRFVEYKIIERNSATIAVSKKFHLTERDLPDSNELFQNFYTYSINAISDADQRKTARRIIEDSLIKIDPTTGHAYRLKVDERTIIDQNDIDSSLLQKLSNIFLLRAEHNTSGGISYEISHDRLLDGLLSMKKERETEEANRRALAEEAERERQLAAEIQRINLEKADSERRRHRALRTIVMSGMLILMAVGAIYVAFQITLASRLANEKAKTDSEKAAEALRFAQEAEDQAQASRQQAEIYLRLIELKTKEAKTAADLAEIKKLGAQKAEVKAKALLEASKLMAAQKLPENFDALIPLDSLDCTGWGLGEISPEIGKLQYLQSLDLRANQLDSIPDEIGNLQNLQSLMLLGNQLSSLPAEIGNLQNLQEIDLSFNQLSSLPAEIGNLQNLQSLMLIGNQLSSLPAEIGNLQNLQQLMLSHNQLSSLTAEIGNLQNLQELGLSSNQLSSLPAEIGNLQNLQWLSLSSNQLSSLPAEIGNLQNLGYLDLSGNQLSSLPIEALRQMPNLKMAVLKEHGNSNPLQPQDIAALRSAMPWCEIVWEE